MGTMAMGTMASRSGSSRQPVRPSDRRQQMAQRPAAAAQAGSGTVDRPPQNSTTAGASSGRPDTFDKQEWWHGLLPREDVQIMLQKQGDFIVRRTLSLSDAGTASDRNYGLSGLVLSVYWNRKHRHSAILQEKATGRYTLYSKVATFGTIVELVRHYARSAEALPQSAVQLLNPVPRQDWELRHEHITVIKAIGKGTFGNVYVGRLLLANKDEIDVAIKESPEGDKQQLTKDESSKLTAEVRIMQKFKHPHVVKLYGMAADKLPIRIVMELCDAGSLDTHLRKHVGRTSVAAKQQWSYEAALGMQYLHSKGCIHKDLAARNCLLHKGKVKIADFGLSEMNTGMAKMGKDAIVPIRWLAPETMSQKYWDYNTDVWSFGIMVWEIFDDAQREPYPELESTKDVLKAVAKQDHRMTLPHSWPPPVRSAIYKCWALVPKQRPHFTQIAHELNPNRII